MFALTKRTDYALIALSHLAQNVGQPMAAREIAQRYGVPQSLMMNILKTLNHADLVQSTRGARGGYVLACPAEEISLEDIITAVEGPVRFVRCADQNDPGCSLIETCPVAGPVTKVHQRLKEFLKSVTLAQIVNDSEYRGAGVALSVNGVCA